MDDRSFGSWSLKWYTPRRRYLAFWGLAIEPISCLNVDKHYIQKRHTICMTDKLQRRVNKVQNSLELMSIGSTWFGLHNMEAERNIESKVYSLVYEKHVGKPRDAPVSLRYAPMGISMCSECNKWTGGAQNVRIWPTHILVPNVKSETFTTLEHSGAEHTWYRHSQSRIHTGLFGFDGLKCSHLGRHWLRTKQTTEIST